MMKIKVPKFTPDKSFPISAERSALMSRIRSTQTKPEQLFRKQLWANGIRYRINSKKLPGRPDIIINKKNLIIFIDGEFWHGYKWKEKKEKIKANRSYWIPKIERNMQRDKENNRALKKMGFTVVRFWEHQIKKDMANCIDKILVLISQL
jgi:DNA mismatch endonuclease, patch repair protein